MSDERLSPKRAVNMDLDEYLRQQILNLPSDSAAVGDYYQKFQGFQAIRDLLRKDGYELALTGVQEAGVE